jgi:CRISPR-associated protein (Cas_Csd1)
MQYSKGYLLGRLLVRLGELGVLETTPEQVYQQAITTPPLVFSKALASLIEAGKEESVRDILKLLPTNSFDSGFNWRDRGAFALGYSHERAGYNAPLEEDSEGSGQEGDLSDRYEFRIDQGLKEWIKVNGGGAFVRTVLRIEQARQGQHHEVVTVQTSPM